MTNLPAGSFWVPIFIPGLLRSGAHVSPVLPLLFWKVLLNESDCDGNFYNPDIKTPGNK